MSIQVQCKVFLVLQVLIPSAFAMDGASPLPASEGPVLEKKSPQMNSKKTEKRRDRRTPLEKETEGTEALDRFEAETVLKSKYQIDGQSLEVDPD